MKPRVNEKRGYLLPKGCKDLVDVLKPKPQPGQVSGFRTIMLPPVVGELTVPNAMTVGELADTLKQKPSRIIADLQKLFGSSVTARHMIQFTEIMQVIRLYGFTPKGFS